MDHAKRIPQGWIEIKEAGEAIRLLQENGVLYCAAPDVADQMAALPRLSAQKEERLLGRIADLSASIEEPLERVVDASLRGEWTGEASRGARIGLRLVRNILDLARLDYCRLHFAQEPIELVEWFSRLAESCRPRIADRDRRLVRVLPDAERCWVLGDADKLARCVLNLISNAIRFTGPGGEIALKLESVGSDAVMTVEDTGCGMDKSQMRRLFTRSDVSREAPAPGMGQGIGMAVVRAFAEGMRGRVAVKSALGRGTSVSIRLPRLCEADVCTGALPKIVSQRTLAIELSTLDE